MHGLSMEPAAIRSARLDDDSSKMRSGVVKEGICDPSCTRSTIMLAVRENFAVSKHSGVISEEKLG